MRTAEELKAYIDNRVGLVSTIGRISRTGLRHDLIYHTTDGVEMLFITIYCPTGEHGWLIGGHGFSLSAEKLEV